MFPFGVDYYPDQTPEKYWETDARLMQEAGINVVRMAEFAWALLEPEDGKFEFAWLDRALAILQAHGISAVLGTPGSSPPAWLIHAHPDLLRVRDDGVRIPYGNRHHFDPSHPLYWEYTRRIVTQMAEHYAQHPAVIGWQINNEFGDRSYSPENRRAFHKWLQKRYGSLEALNAAWGTMFWSHIYRQWEEIPLPLTIAGSPNPGLALDYYRFMSDAYVDYQQMQVDILRKICPTHWITHNFMGFGYPLINYFDLARNLDLVSWDNYPCDQWRNNPNPDFTAIALGHDTMRGLKQKNFWLMEQQAGAGGWEMISMAPRPGALRLWAYQGIAHGADGMVFFRWDTCRYGTEQYWHGLLDHHRQPSRRYYEIKQMGAEIACCGENIRGSKVKASIAMILSNDARFAFQIQGNNPQFNYNAHFVDIYRAFHRRQIMVDVVEPGADLSQYQIVVAPALHVVTEAIAENLKTYVSQGGTLVLTPRSGVKDASNAVVEMHLPGLLAELCGVEVEEYDSLPPEVKNQIEFVWPDKELSAAESPEVGIFCEILSPTTAQILALYKQDYYQGRPAITVNPFGLGKTVYVGTLGKETLYQPLVNWLLEIAEIQGVLSVAEGIEVTERWQDEQRILFILNHTTQNKILPLPGHWRNCLEDSAPLVGLASIPPRGVLVLAESKDENQA